MPDDKQTRTSSLPRVIVFAAMAGVLAGAAAIYVTGGFEGNTGQDGSTGEGAPVVVGAAPDDKACAAKTERATTVAAAATGHVAAMLPADPPQSLKTLAFNDPAGQPTTLNSLAGKTVLLNLWATWCVPCRTEMPALDALQKEKGGPSFEVVAVNVDKGDDTKPKKFLTETSIGSLGYYRDNTLGLFETLKERGLALGLPVTLLIDAEGCLLAHMNGPAEWASDDAKRLIDTAVGG